MKKVKIQMDYTSIEHSNTFLKSYGLRNKATSLKWISNCPVRTMVIIHQDEGGEELINVLLRKFLVRLESKS